MSDAWLFVLITLDGVVPLVPGEAAFLSRASSALDAGAVSVIELIALGTSAAFLGDIITYLVGRRFGTRRFAWQRRPRVARLIDWTGATLARRGAALIVTARVLPGWRVAITFTAGATRLPLPRFLAASAVGALLWATYLLIVGGSVGAVTGASGLSAALWSLLILALVGMTLRWAGRRSRRVRSPLAKGPDIHHRPRRTHPAPPSTEGPVRVRA
ncbi:DedA family protein [Aeromicrobium phragmitis]|nr:DedA family protein [Aeromicrobium phragmitis]